MTANEDALRQNPTKLHIPQQFRIWNSENRKSGRMFSMAEPQPVIVWKMEATAGFTALNRSRDHPHESFDCSGDVSTGTEVQLAEF